MRARVRFGSAFVVLLALASSACSSSGDPTAPTSPMSDGGSGSSAGIPMPPAPLAAGDYLFVLNRGSRDVSILSAASGYAEVRRLSLPGSGSRPSKLAVDPSTRTLYVSFADSGSDVLALGFDGAERARKRFEGSASDLAVDASRGILAVATGSGVAFLDGATLERAGSAKTGVGRTGAWSLAVSSPAGLAVVSNSLDDEVALVSMEGSRLLARVPSGAFPSGIGVLGDRAFVAATDADRVDVVGLSGAALLDSIPVGNGPSSVVVDAAHARVYVANDLSGDVSVLDAEGVTETARWAFHHAIPDLAISPDGSILFVCHPSGARVEMVDAATGADRGAAAVGVSPQVLEAVTLR